VRERVAARLEQIPPLPALGSAAAPDEVLRLHGRVREMIQDATRKGERVLAAGERASRAAHRFVRRLEEEAREMEGLVVRLAPPASRAPRVEPTAGEEPAPRLKPLRLLEPGEPKSAEPAKGREGRRGARLERDPGDRGERT